MGIARGRDSRPRSNASRRCSSAAALCSASAAASFQGAVAAPSTSSESTAALGRTAEWALRLASKVSLSTGSRRSVGVDGRDGRRRRVAGHADTDGRRNPGPWWCMVWDWRDALFDGGCWLGAGWGPLRAARSGLLNLPLSRVICEALRPLAGPTESNQTPTPRATPPARPVDACGATARCRRVLPRRA